jgi:phospholipid/cholesterol/gamma-HCH transport system permease protein
LVSEWDRGEAFRRRRIDDWASMSASPAKGTPVQPGMSSPRPAGLEWIPDQARLRLTGSWTTPALRQASRALGRLPLEGDRITIDGQGLTDFDTAGALLLYRLVRALREGGKEVELSGLGERHSRLLALVEGRLEEGEQAARHPAEGRLGPLARVGRRALDWGADLYIALSFAGGMAASFGNCLQRPSRLRWRNMLAVIESDGVKAMPVLGMLSFLLGVVIAYQSGVQLRLYGGNLYVVDLVTITVLRELGPLMTAIVVAGRSGSAYTAQIGTMQVTEEIDALRSIGVAPMELLVLPKVLGLIIALPLLAMFSNVLTVFGGMVMAAGMLDVSFETFLRRIPDAVSINSLLSGLGKTPVFALVIAAVGCYQGFQVQGGAESVGRRTTTSVVQAIVLVILVDSAFSVAYSALDI